MKGGGNAWRAVKPRSHQGREQVGPRRTRPDSRCYGVGSGLRMLVPEAVSSRQKPLGSLVPPAASLLSRPRHFMLVVLPLSPTEEQSKVLLAPVVPGLRL